MIEVLPHLVSGLALTIVGWAWNDNRALRKTVHDLELAKERIETRLQVVSKLEEKVEQLPTRHDLEAVKETLCQRIDDIRR